MEFNMKMPFYQYRNSYFVIEKVCSVARSSYPYHGNTYTWKMAFILHQPNIMGLRQQYSENSFRKYIRHIMYRCWKRRVGRIAVFLLNPKPARQVPSRHTAIKPQRSNTIAGDCRMAMTSWVCAWNISTNRIQKKFYTVSTGSMRNIWPYW